MSLHALSPLLLLYPNRYETCAKVVAPFDIFVQDTTHDDAKASQIHDSLPGDLRKTTIRYDPHSKTWDILDSIF